MLQIITAFEILPIKPGFNKKKIKKTSKKFLYNYHPARVVNVKPKELQEILAAKYDEIFKTANHTRTSIIKGEELTYNSQEAYDRYITTFKQELKNFNKEDFIIILKANGLPVDGTKTQLQDRILDHVQSIIASLNLEEDYI